ncbi:hypothetical protein [Treponema primitia]|uniref:hypothetical protein n=1 Tax=Treponema primitia TaxID=88058 RepID=UPI000255568C|nr:hypothetical protein [Treponema primitia]
MIEQLLLLFNKEISSRYVREWFFLNITQSHNSINSIFGALKIERPMLKGCIAVIGLGTDIEMDCLNDKFILLQNGKIKEYPIPQSEDGIDTEDRIEVAKKIIGKLL